MSTDKATQKQRILRMLQDAGGEWVSGVTLHDLVGWSYAQRISNLNRKDGHDIESTGKGHGVAQYRIRGAA